MLNLYIALAFLGLSAIDPVGIGIMPILLVQEHPYKRVAAFLGGSFLSLMTMGLLFAKGFGQLVLKFERSHSWFIPTVETIAGVILLITAITVYVRLKAGKASVEPSERTHRWLKFRDWQLFSLGILLVAGQSVVDVVFVIAMVRIGQLKLSGLALVAAVATYAIAALILQLLVVGAFRFAPIQRKTQTLNAIHTLLVKYSNQALIIASLILSIAFFTLAFKK